MIIFSPYPRVIASGTTYTVTRTVQVDNDIDTSTSAGWNCWPVNGGNPAALATILDTAGATTGWNFTTSTSWSSNNLGTTTNNNSGVYPDAVLTSIWYTGSTIAQGLSFVNFNGLDNGRYYDISVLGTRTGTTDRGSTYRIGSDTRTQVADNNTRNVTTFEKIRPTSGNIKLLVGTGAGNSGANGGFGYLSAFVVREFTGS